MAQYISSTNLTAGATGGNGNPITVDQVNGLNITTSATVPLPNGSVEITTAGVMTFDDGNDTSYFPPTGSQSGNGSFTYRLTDGTNFSPTYTVDIDLNRVTTSGGTTPATVRAALSTLYSTVGLNGAPVTPITSGNAPAGVTVSATTPIVNVTQDNVTLSGFDFTGKRLTVNAGVSTATIENNLFGRSDGVEVSLGKNYHLELEADTTNFIIRNNDFDGHQLNASTGFPMNFLNDGNLWTNGAILQATGSTVSNMGGIIRNNRFRWLTNDGIKATGGLQVEENVMGAFSNVPFLPSETWNASSSYNVGDIVGNTAIDSGWVYVCKVAHTNQPLPNGVTGDNVYWKGIDPHCDHFNMFENLQPSTFLRNVVYRNSQHPDIPAADRAYYIKATNSYRMTRNTGSSKVYANLQMIENASIGAALHGAAKPIQCEQAGQPNWTDPTWTDNLIDFDGGYFSTNDDYVDGGNFDWTTLAAI